MIEPKPGRVLTKDENPAARPLLNEKAARRECRLVSRERRLSGECRLDFSSDGQGKFRRALPDNDGRGKFR